MTVKCPSDPAPDSERIPTPDESGVRVVGTVPTYSVHYRGVTEPFGNEYEDALERSRELGYGATVVRDHDGALMSAGSAENPLRKAFRESQRKQCSINRGWMAVDTAEKIARAVS